MSDTNITATRAQVGSEGVRLIARERLRQLTDEGFDYRHDDSHGHGEPRTTGAGRSTGKLDRRAWPWEWESFKPSPGDRPRELAKAGALIAAEIDRLERDAPAPALVGTPPQTALHPNTLALLRYFDHEHLPSHLQAVSKPFRDLAVSLATAGNLDGPELTVGLRKLLEAKDCMVRAALTGAANG